MKRTVLRAWSALVPALILAVARPPAAHSQNAVASLLPAAVAVEIQDAGGKALRTVNGTVVPQGVIVPVTALAGGQKAAVRARGGQSWTTSQVLATNAAVGLALLGLPAAPPVSVSFPPSGAYMAKTRVFLLNGPGIGPDSVSARIYEHFALRGGADLCPVKPGAPGAAPAVDPTGRFLGVVVGLAESGPSYGYIVPMASVRVVANAAAQGAEISSFAASAPPAFTIAESALGQLFRGAVLTRAEEFDAARTCLDAALKKDPNSAEAYFWSGQAFFGAEQFLRAAEEFVQAGTKDPSFQLAWHMAGAAQNQAGDYNKAIEMYMQALKIDPRSAQTYCNLGGAYYNLQRVDDAVAAFRRSIELDPRYARGLAYMNLAQVLKNAGRASEAEEVYQSLVKVNAEWAQRLREALDGQP